MAAKKKPAYQDPSKKNRATTKDKPNTSSRTDVNGRSGMGLSSTRSTFESRTGIRQNKTLNNAQNIARSVALGGGIGKAVVSAVARKVVSKAAKPNKSGLTGSGTYTTTNKNAAKEYAGRGGAGTKASTGKDAMPPNTYGTPNKKLAEQYAKKKKK